MGTVHSDPVVSPARRSGITRQGQRYCLITPCRDEARYARKTLESVVRQTVPPARWVIVDDGSKDETAAIVESYAERYPFITLIRRKDRGARKVGAGVIEAFNEGLAAVDLDEFDFVCKFDLDLEMPAAYFQVLMRRMAAEPRLGTTSGKPWFVHPRSAALAPEICGDEMSVGMAKFYRVACFRDIGGFVSQVMWDGIDCHRARMLGWLAESVDDSAIRFIHLRPQGASHKGIWTGRVRAGFGQYFMGTSPIYYAVAAGSRLWQHPPVIGSAAMLWGYMRSALQRVPRYGDAEFRRFLRAYQHACLRLGKRRATAHLNARQAAVWNRRINSQMVTSGGTLESRRVS
jgi:biofilm PGA synthesis N-glycosyltransferase PgaC